MLRKFQEKGKFHKFWQYISGAQRHGLCPFNRRKCLNCLLGYRHMEYTCSIETEDVTSCVKQRLYLCRGANFLLRDLIYPELSATSVYFKCVWRAFNPQCQSDCCSQMWTLFNFFFRFALSRQEGKIYPRHRTCLLPEGQKELCDNCMFFLVGF